MKTIYRYDADFKFFISEDTAQPDPNIPGEYLFPANSTEIIPPKCGDCCVAIFNEDENEWEVVVDKRGIYYNIETKECINNISDPCFCVDGYTKIKPISESSDKDIVSWNGEQWINEIQEKEVDGNLTYEEKLNKVLKTNSVEVFEKVIEVYKTNYPGTDGLFTAHNISQSDLLNYLNIGSALDRIPKWIVLFGEYYSFVKEQYEGYEVSEILDSLNIDPYQLKDLLDNLPPKTTETDTTSQ